MRQLSVVVLVVSLFCAAVVPVAAQSTTATVTTQAPIYLRPGMEVPLRVASAGTLLNVLKEEAEWVEVEFNDPQWGRRVGWVQAKLLRLSRPELEPMDLSVQEVPASRPAAEGSTAPAPAQLPPPDAGSALKPQVRQGFWFNVGMGYGTLGCEDCITRDHGLSGGLSLGAALGDHVLLGVGTTGFAREFEGELFSVGTLDARVRVYPAKRSGFFINAGLGLGSVAYAGEYEFGLGAMLGVGWDIRVGRNVSLTPFWNGFAMANSNIDANVGQIGLGITIH
jgi:hypothetical protein